MERETRQRHDKRQRKDSAARIPGREIGGDREQVQDVEHGLPHYKREQAKPQHHEDRKNLH